jgi:hypothetical protein
MQSFINLFGTLVRVHQHPGPRFADDGAQLDGGRFLEASAETGSARKGNRK